MKPDGKSTGTIHIGVDVSKAKLDIYVPAAKEGVRPTTEEVDNDRTGFKRLRDLARKSGATVCVEPTGGYELELIAYLHRSDVAVAYADALRVRQFARAEGSLSKNDRADAALISRFADKIGVRLLEERDMASVELKRKMRFRQRMLDIRTMCANQLETETDGDMRACLKREISHLTAAICKVERLCREIVARDERKQSLVARFTEVGGVGENTAIAVLAGLPEIGTLSDAKLNRLVGISPEEKRSGTMQCQNRIRGGRKDVRNALYMACVAALLWNSTLGDYYRKKRGEGHPHKWAIVPTMRKLLSLLNRIARDPGFRPQPEPESTKRNALATCRRKPALG